MFDIAGTVDACAAELAEVLGAIAIFSPAAFAFNGGPPVDVASAAASGMWAQGMWQGMWAQGMWGHGMWGHGMWGQGAWGEPSGAPPRGASGEPEGRNPDAALVQALQNALYDGCYAHRLGAPRAAPATTLADDPAFAQELARANAGSERWEPGWAIQQLAPNGQVFVRKGERERIAVPGAFISAIAPGMVAQPGGNVLLRAPAGALGVQPGYYFAFGETLEELAEQLSLVRFYFHCTADDAAPLLGALTSLLNCFQDPVPDEAAVRARPLRAHRCGSPVSRRALCTDRAPHRRGGTNHHSARYPGAAVRQAALARHRGGVRSRQR